MPYNFKNPKTVEEVEGPDSIDCSSALTVVYRIGLSEKHDADKRHDVAALALMYAAHLSAEHAPFDVEFRSLLNLDAQGYLKFQFTNEPSTGVKVRLLPLAL